MKYQLIYPLILKIMKIMMQRLAEIKRCAQGMRFVTGELGIKLKLLGLHFSSALLCVCSTLAPTGKIQLKSACCLESCNPKLEAKWIASKQAVMIMMKYIFQFKIYDL